MLVLLRLPASMRLRLREVRGHSANYTSGPSRARTSVQLNSVLVAISVKAEGNSLYGDLDSH